MTQQWMKVGPPLLNPESQTLMSIVEEKGDVDITFVRQTMTTNILQHIISVRSVYVRFTAQHVKNVNCE